MPKLKLHINPLHILIFVISAEISGVIAGQNYSDTFYWIATTLFCVFLGGLVLLTLFQIIYPLYLKFKK
jgi:hypothetical protein